MLAAADAEVEVRRGATGVVTARPPLGGVGGRQVVAVHAVDGGGGVGLGSGRIVALHHCSSHLHQIYCENRYLFC